MEQVKQMVEAGSRIPTAVKEALIGKGLTIPAFAEKHDLNESATRNAIAGIQRASEKILTALVSELGGSPDEWAELLWLAGKPASISGTVESKLAANQ